MALGAELEELAVGVAAGRQLAATVAEGVRGETRKLLGEEPASNDPRRVAVVPNRCVNVLWITNGKTPQVSTWESARRARLPNIALSIVLAVMFVFLGADQIGDLSGAKRAAAWGRLLLVTTLTLASSTAFFAYSTLRGPAFKQDPDKPQPHQARNQALRGWCSASLP